MKKKSFLSVAKKVFNIVTDIILYPIILVSMVIGLTTLAAKGKSEIKKVFGYTVVTILTGSMEAGGFFRNDVVLLEPFEVKNLRPGDIIAFYSFLDNEDPSVIYMDLITDFDALPEVTSEQPVTGNATVQDAINNKSLVLFHRIHAVYMADDGTWFFQTKGDSNHGPDPILIRGDFIVGKYAPIPPAIENTITFMATPDGLIYIVIIPLSIMIFFQIIEVVTIIFAILTEKKVLAGEIPFDSPESIKADVGKEMRDFDKVYFYDISKAADKPRVKNFLWGYLNEPTATDKQKKKYAEVEMSLQIYPQSRDEYWRFWIIREKKGRYRRKLENLQKVSNILHKAVSVSKQEPLDLLAKRAALPARPKKVEDPGFLEIKKQTLQLEKNKESNKKD